MFKKKKKVINSSSDSSSFWIPYSDIMAGLLGIFALLLVITIYKLGEPLENVRSLLEERREVVEELKTSFNNDNRIEITDAGSIRLLGEILFDPGKDVLNDDGKTILSEVMPLYLGVIALRPQFTDQLSRVLIEGHADPSFASSDSLAAYLYNLDLSQRRASNVIQFLLSCNELLEYNDFMKKYFMASGRSSADLIYDEITLEPNYEKSRRIQIDFLMKDKELVDQIMQAIGLGG
jgi:chemotaxis protein MotB